jgi:putative transposase
MNQTTCRKTSTQQLRPTPAQARQLACVLWRCSTRSTTARTQRGTAAKRRRRVALTRLQEEAERQTIRAAFPAYAASHSQVLQDVLARLDQASHAFFRRAVNGAKLGFPRFQGRSRWHSLTCKEHGHSAPLDNGCLVLSTIGRPAVCWSRPFVGTITTGTLATEAQGWYVACACAEVPSAPLPRTGGETSLAVGRQVLLLTAGGDSVANPRHDRRAERAVRQAQRRLSRRTKGHQRRRKASTWLTEPHQHVGRGGRGHRDLHHQTALALLRTCDVNSGEASPPANLSLRPAPRPEGHGGYAHNGASRTVGLNTSMRGAGWRQDLIILACKATWAGERVAAVNPASTTQNCAGCGAHIEKSVSVRTHVSPHCGLVLDRDEYTARNFHWRGQRLRGVPALAGALPREPAGLSPVRSVREHP